MVSCLMYTFLLSFVYFMIAIVFNLKRVQAIKVNCLWDLYFSNWTGKLDHYRIFKGVFSTSGWIAFRQGGFLLISVPNGNFRYPTPIFCPFFRNAPLHQEIFTSISLYDAEFAAFLACSTWPLVLIMFSGRDFRNCSRQRRFCFFVVLLNRDKP